MIKVTLDLTCSVCGHQQFYLPVRHEEGANVSCANCTAFKCKTLDLEKALKAIGRPSRIASQAERPAA
ncbi:hypothetical protein [Salinicola rhizosphaerae]|uniref:Uncharacterized protein n=1 Tax=Salinicola rhizosphaerae TaxID=1443141 RepID=A0ABQ3EC80_9GAMM|nr:hypothetical protein [Salinicola rhizosphaerae]GHB33134.1 hypothetical protein GCM10009038_35160 [Salinicola rhizosphaerae]